MPVPVLPLVAPMRAQGDALEDTVMPQAALEPALATSVSVNGATLPFSPKATKASTAPLPKLVAGGSPSEPLPCRGHRDSDVDASESPLASSPHHSMFRRLLRRTSKDGMLRGLAAPPRNLRRREGAYVAAPAAQPREVVTQVVDPNGVLPRGAPPPELPPGPPLERAMRLLRDVLQQDGDSVPVDEGSAKALQESLSILEGIRASETLSNEPKQVRAVRALAAQVRESGKEIDKDMEDYLLGSAVPQAGTRRGDSSSIRLTSSLTVTADAQRSLSPFMPRVGCLNPGARPRRPSFFNGQPVSSLSKTDDLEPHRPRRRSRSQDSLLGDPSETFSPSDPLFSVLSNSASGPLADAELDWRYDVLKLDEDTHGKCLSTLFAEVVCRHDLLARLDSDGCAIDPLKLGAFIRHCEVRYGDNPYHNRRHAADVLLGMHRFLVTTSAVTPEEASRNRCVPSAPNQVARFEGLSFSAIETFAALMAAVIHDFQHPGTTNQHEIRKNSPLALQYHDESVLESHHLAKAFAALMLPANNFVATWERKSYMEFRALVIKLVLMTDLSKHFDHVEQLKGLADGGLLQKPTDTYTDAHLALVVGIKFADLGHTIKPFPLHLKWSQFLTDEFFALGDQESKEGLPISPLCDRDNDCDLARNQIGFLSFVAMPFYSNVARVLPGHAVALEQLEQNLEEWQLRAEVDAETPVHSLITPPFPRRQSTM